MIAGCVLGVKDNIDIFDISKYTDLWLVAFLFEPAGAAAGFGIATMLGMDNASRVRSERQREPHPHPPHTLTSALDWPRFLRVLIHSATNEFPPLWIQATLRSNCSCIIQSRVVV